MLNSLNDRIAAAQADSEHGFISGTVVEVDTTGLGRVKVHIPNLMEPELGEVPWIGQHRHSPFGQGPGYGVYGTPVKGSKVRVYLQDGDILYGLMAADELHASDVNQEFKDPTTWGFADPTGNKVPVNMTTNEWTFFHSKGYRFFLDGAGNLSITVPKNKVETVGGNQTATITGNDVETVRGSKTANITSNFTINVNGNTVFNTQGDTSINSQGTINVNASGACNVTGNPVNLN